VKYEYTVSKSFYSRGWYFIKGEKYDLVDKTNNDVILENKHKQKLYIGVDNFNNNFDRFL
jgi:hypothetical protein